MSDKQPQTFEEWADEMFPLGPDSWHQRMLAQNAWEAAIASQQARELTALRQRDQLQALMDEMDSQPAWDRLKGQLAEAKAETERLRDDLRMTEELADSRVSARAFASMHNRYEAVVGAARELMRWRYPSRGEGEDSRISSLRAALAALDKKC